MHRIRSFALALLGLLLVAGSVSSQGKDKDKDPKLVKYPTEISGKSLKKWIEEIRDPYDPSVRQRAIRTVVQFGPASAAAVPSLLAATKEADASLRNDAATAIGALFAVLNPTKEKDAEIMRRSITALMSLAQDEQRPVRIHALAALASIGAVPQFHPYTRSAIPLICNVMRDQQAWEVRKAAAQALGAISLNPREGPDAHAMKALTIALNDPCAPVRLEAINSLSMLGLSPRKSEVDAEKVALEKRLHDRDKTVTLWARTLLMFLDEKMMNEYNISIIAHGLDDTDLRVRCQAATILGTLGRKARSRVPDLVNAANDREDELAITALHALARMDDPSCLPALLKLANDVKSSAAVRCAAIRALGPLGDKTVLANLVGFLTNKEMSIQISALVSLAAMGELAQSAIPNIKPLTGSEDEYLAFLAKETIRAINTDKPLKKQ